MVNHAVLPLQSIIIVIKLKYIVNLKVITFSVYVLHGVTVAKVVFNILIGELHMYFMLFYFVCIILSDV